MYPNPAQYNITLAFDAEGVAGTTTAILIYDVMGKNVYQMPISLQNGKNEYIIPLESLPKGCYFLQYMNGAERKNIPFVKE